VRSGDAWSPGSSTISSGFASTTTGAASSFPSYDLACGRTPGLLCSAREARST
jgi:hypothetical protein